ncbi:MAG: hypothetical protein E4G90_05445 [Gemmatimonadales bacterium]|nr:MAG: hypothetical protein E4G90_05445 [Gemmatimonadales bacterium]
MTQAAQRMLVHLEEMNPEVAKYINQVVKGGQLGPEGYGILEKRLAKLDPSFIEPFQLARFQLDERMARIFSDLEREAGAVAIVSVVGDCCEGDAYVQALQTLLERVVALFRQAPHSEYVTPIVLRVHVAQRNLRIFDGMESERMALWHVQTMCDQMRRCPPYGQNRKKGTSPAFIPLPSGVWDANHDSDCHPGIVLADYISYRAYCALRDSKKQNISKLSSVSSSFRFRVPLPLERTPGLGSEVLPTLAATGRAREAILAAYLPEEKEDPLTGLKPTWMAEQSILWQRFARRFPREEEGT